MGTVALGVGNSEAAPVIWNFTSSGTSLSVSGVVTIESSDSGYVPGGTVSNTSGILDFTFSEDNEGDYFATPADNFFQDFEIIFGGSVHPDDLSSVTFEVSDETAPVAAGLVVLISGTSNGSLSVDVFGSETHTNGTFSLAPGVVPEPSTCVLILTALAAVGFYRWRQRQYLPF